MVYADSFTGLIVRWSMIKGRYAFSTADWITAVGNTLLGFRRVSFCRKMRKIG
jgi:hypothetical protein